MRNKQNFSVRRIHWHNAGSKEALTVGGDAWTIGYAKSDNSSSAAPLRDVPAPSKYCMYILYDGPISKPGKLPEVLELAGPNSSLLKSPIATLPTSPAVVSPACSGTRIQTG